MPRVVVRRRPTNRVPAPTWRSSATSCPATPWPPGSDRRPLRVTCRPCLALGWLTRTRSVPAPWVLSGTLRLPAGADSVSVPPVPTPAALTLTVRSQPPPGVSVQRDGETCQAPPPLVTDAPTVIGCPEEER